MNLIRELDNYNENRLTDILSKRRLSAFPRPSKPLFVIKYGPAASGKSSLPVRKWFQSVKVQYEDVLHINIDDIVESVGFFRTKSRQVAAKVFSSKNLTKLTANEIDPLSSVYTSVRTTKNSKGLSLTNKFDRLLLHALQSKVHVSIETTGSMSWPQWLFQGEYRKWLKFYRVVVIFPLVPVDVGYRRYVQRAKRMYYNNASSGVRLGLTRDQYKKTYDASYKHFQDAMKDTKQTAMIDGVYLLADEQVLPWPMLRA